MSLDEWLKSAPADVVPSVDDPMGAGLPEDLPDLGLGSLSAEDIKWVDLEFLDLASGPPANQEKNRNKNPTLGYNFPDIFFGDAAFSSSLFNTNFSIEDFKPFGDTFKDATLDLETVEKNILADLFPPSASIEPQAVETSDHDREDEEEEVFASAGATPTSNNNTSVASSSSSSATAKAITSKDAKVNGTLLDDGVYSVPIDVLQIISKDFDDFENRQRHSEGVNKASPAAPKTTKATIPAVPGLKEAKISNQISTRKSGAQVVLLEGVQSGIKIKVDEEKVTSLLKPLHLDDLPIFVTEDKKIKEDESGSERSTLPGHVQFKEIRVVKNQTSVRKLAEHGVTLEEGLTCATTESGLRYWICPEPDCKKAYTRPSKLKIHLLAHKDIKPFKCPLPSLTMKTKQCTWGFVTNSKLQRHIESHKKLKNYACAVPECGRKFSTIYNLNKHLKNHEREPKFPCELCPAKYESEKNLAQHLRDDHGDEAVPAHPCTEPECVAGGGGGGGERRFFSSGELRSHLRAEHRSYSRCSFAGCGKTFRKPCQLKTHYRVHSGVRPFACQLEGCAWAFATASKLRRHEKGHENVRAHVCHVCGKSYLRNEHLRGHMLTHAKVVLPPVLACPVGSCPRGDFESVQLLRAHVEREEHTALVSSSSATAPSLLLRCLVQGCAYQCHSWRELSHHTRSGHKQILPELEPLLSLFEATTAPNVVVLPVNYSLRADLCTVDTTAISPSDGGGGSNNKAPLVATIWLKC